jgi:hypothetical protein
MSALESRPNEAPEPAMDCPRTATGRGMAFKLAALILTVISALAGTGLARWLRQPPSTPAPTKDTPPAQNLFAGWNKPDLALVLTAQMHGYLLPCGCSRPQVGGLERRYNLIQNLRDRGWPLALYDLGDVPQKKGPLHLGAVQNLIKYEYAMRALEKMGYNAVGLGEYDAALTITAVSGWVLNQEKPKTLVGNFSEATKAKGYSEIFPAVRIDPIPNTPLKVGVTSLVGPKVAQQIKDPDLTFAESGPALKAALGQMDKEGATVRVLLYHGSLTGTPKGWAKPEPIACAEAFPQFQVVLALNEEDEPSHDPVIVKHPGGRQTLVIGLGQKGKYVGVVGLFRTNDPKNPFTARYQPVELTEKDFQTPQGKEDSHPIVHLMEDYTKQLRNEDYLRKIADQQKSPVFPGLQSVPPGAQPRYVGSERCMKCHEHAYNVWKKTPHSWAYKTLVEEAKRPGNRQFDPECVVCHTVGFGYKTGWYSPDPQAPGKRIDVPQAKAEGKKEVPELRNVGCESCHGPASEHVRDPENKTWHALMNPWKAPSKETAEEKTRRINRIDQFCQHCHDIDNDVTWKNNAFERKWPLIIHMTPPLP